MGVRQLSSQRKRARPVTDSPLGKYIVLDAHLHKVINFNVLCVEDARVVRLCPLAERSAHVDVVVSGLGRIANITVHLAKMREFCWRVLVGAPQPQNLQNAKAVSMPGLDRLVVHKVHL